MITVRDSDLTFESVHQARYFPSDLFVGETDLLCIPEGESPDGEGWCFPEGSFRRGRVGATPVPIRLAR